MANPWSNKEVLIRFKVGAQNADGTYHLTTTNNHIYWYAKSEDFELPNETFEVLSLKDEISRLEERLSRFEQLRDLFKEVME